MATLRADAEAIWQAAIAAVAPQQLVETRLSVEAGDLCCDGRPLQPPVQLTEAKRIVVVGGGKAAASLAEGLERVLPAEMPVAGLIGVPEGCGRSLPRIEVREVRPAGRNEPTEACVLATRQMCDMLAGLSAHDIAIAVITGGGSAILTSPMPAIPLSEVIATTRWLSEQGADIGQLNRVRQALSDVKAGGLARHCRAGRLVAVVISDVIGDPLATISSGPCMPVEIDAAEALAILEQFGAVKAGVGPTIVAHLRKHALEAAVEPAESATQSTEPATAGQWQTPAGCVVSHHLLCSNAMAVEAAAAEAARRGYVVRVRHADPSVHETATQVGQRLADEAAACGIGGAGQRLAIIEGGEATVQLPADHGLGGRNQQTVVSAVTSVLARKPWPRGLLIASLGTDGEDGPTSAAGGMADMGIVTALTQTDGSLADALRRCDAYPLLAQAGGLIHTGPTGTNVADVRIMLLENPPRTTPPNGATSHGLPSADAAVDG